MIDAALVKTLLIRLVGERPAAVVQGVRFALLLWLRPRPDPEIALLPHLLERGEVAVDVGASGADWALYLSRRVGPEGVVLAFEPDPFQAQATEVALRFLRRRSVTLLNLGLSDRAEKVSLKVMDGRGRRLSGLVRVDRDAAEGQAGTVKATLVTLDSLVDRWPQLLATRVLKCDVEGFELFVLRGARRVLGSARPVVIFEVGRFAEQGYSNEEVGSFFLSLDYKVFGADGGGKLVPADRGLGVAGVQGVNRVALPSERLSRYEALMAGSTVSHPEGSTGCPVGA